MLSDGILSANTNLLESVKFDDTFDDACAETAPGDTILPLPLDVELGESGDASSFRRNGKDETGDRDRNRALLQLYVGKQKSNNVRFDGRFKLGK